MLLVFDVKASLSQTSQIFPGLLQCNNGTILKPIIKPSQQREVDFYSRVSSSTEPEIMELRACIPKYFGTTHHMHGGLTQEYIVLEDLCDRMMEPCIMDVKIGKCAWENIQLCFHYHFISN